MDYTINYARAGGNSPTPAIVLTDPWYTGVAKPGSTYTHGNFEIYGGSITESKSWRSAFLDHLDRPERRYCCSQRFTILLSPPIRSDSSPIIGDISDSGWQIYNNKIYYSSTTTSSRYAFYGDAIWIGNQEQAPGPYNGPDL